MSEKDLGKQRRQEARRAERGKKAAETPAEMLDDEEDPKPPGKSTGNSAKSTRGSETSGNSGKSTGSSGRSGNSGKSAGRSATANSKRTTR